MKWIFSHLFVNVVVSVILLNHLPFIRSLARINTFQKEKNIIAQQVFTQ
jgi:hypothetical protein